MIKLPYESYIRTKHHQNIMDTAVDENNSSSEKEFLTRNMN